MNEVHREWGDDGEIDLFQGVLFVWRARWLVLLGLLGGAALGYLAGRLLPPSYAASTNIFVAMPVKLSDVVADPTDVDALDRVARTDAVQESVRAAIERDGATIAAFRTVVDRSLTDLRQSLATLTMIVTASDAQLAQRAADLWADTVVSEEAKRAEAARATTVQFFERQFQASLQRLLERQKALEAASKTRGTDLAVASAEVDNAKANFIRAGKRLDEAQLVVNNREAAIRRGSPAAPPVPRRSSPLKLAMAGAVAGLAVSLFTAWVRLRLRGA